jgi:F-type H+-transporting ATPase subunit epsilon
VEVSLLTPQQVVFTGPVDEVLVNADKGQLDILKRHADLVTEVKKGLLTIKYQGKSTAFEVTDGVLRIEGERCSILVMEARAA